MSLLFRRTKHQQLHNSALPSCNGLTGLEPGACGPLSIRAARAQNSRDSAFCARLWLRGDPFPSRHLQKQWKPWPCDLCQLMRRTRTEAKGLLFVDVVRKGLSMAGVSERTQRGSGWCLVLERMFPAPLDCFRDAGLGDGLMGYQRSSGTAAVAARLVETASRCWNVLLLEMPA